MGATDIERRALKGGRALPPDPRRIALFSSVASAPAIEPLAVRLADATALSGFSRSGLYRMAARGEIVFLKCGDRVLVEYESLKKAIAALPRAQINIAV